MKKLYAVHLATIKTEGTSGHEQRGQRKGEGEG
jgi:hypothetical protein